MDRGELARIGNKIGNGPSAVRPSSRCLGRAGLLSRCSLLSFSFDEQEGSQVIHQPIRDPIYAS